MIIIVHWKVLFAYVDCIPPDDEHGCSGRPAPSAILIGILPWLLIFVIFYMLMIRPQQKRVKEHQADDRRGQEGR